MGDSNAERQQRFAAKAKASGKIRIHAWVEVSTANQLKELATQSETTIGDIINMVIGMVYPPDQSGQTDQTDQTDQQDQIQSLSPHASESAQSSGSSSQQVPPARSPYIFRPVPANDMPKLETPASTTEKISSRNKSLFFYAFMVIMIGIGVVSWYRILPQGLSWPGKVATPGPVPQKNEIRLDVANTAKSSTLPVTLPALPVAPAASGNLPAAPMAGPEDRLKLTLAVEFKR
ncbi:MAG: hypothetical protein H7833_10650 [Magnetococcus sp. DMHC-1]|nr:hypothetical protein [Magnetococcales bacterium]